MLKVRTTITASKNIAVQVVSRNKGKTRIIKHIGTARDNEGLQQLLKLANQYILEKDTDIPLFPEIYGQDTKKGGHHLASVENLEFTAVYHKFAYEFLSFFYEYIGFKRLNNNLLRDLAIIRIIEPSSKIRSIELIKKYFGIKYPKNTMYTELLTIRKLKPEIEKISVEYAKMNLAFDFSMVFYDVTTLYFETFTEDDFRKCGFSKDNKSKQPQVLVALVVNKDGYPIAIDVFEGNKFEGHTMIPVILRLKEKHNLDNLAIVADAAMLSIKNILELEKYGLKYIVAARLSNLPEKSLKHISKYINKKEFVYYQEETPLGLLICDYSEKRAAKNRSDRKKQIQRAQYQINNPGKAMKRLRFVKETTKSFFKLNDELIERDKLLDGIKGYYTNLKDADPSLVVSRYKDLWIIEKSFRIAKSDLLARPIFLRKKEKIEAHILIVFLSLCISKVIELLTMLSIKKVRDIIWDILDIEFIDTLTNKKFLKRMDSSNNTMFEFLRNMKNTY